MSNRVFWSYADEAGENPTGEPGEFEFEIWHEFTSYDAEHAPQVEITGVTCTSVRLFNAKPPARKPEPAEEEEFSDWFSSYLDSHPKERQAVLEQAREQAYIEPDYDDRDD